MTLFSTILALIIFLVSGGAFAQGGARVGLGPVPKLAPIQSKIVPSISYGRPRFNTNVSSISSINLGPSLDLYNCHLPSEGDLDNLHIQTNWTGCYEGRLHSFSVPAPSDKEMLKKDSQICGCLRGSLLEPVQHMMNGNLLNLNSIKNQDSVRQSLKQNLTAKVQDPAFQNEVNEELSRVLNGIQFHAGILSGSPEFTDAYSSNLFSPADNKPVVEVTEKGVELHAKFQPNPELNLDKPFIEGQCVSPREFWRSRQFPGKDDAHSEFIWKELAAETFDEDKWNYNILESQYRNLMSLSLHEKQRHREEIVGLKAKLIFLNRNPMIKYFLGSSKDDLDVITRSQDIDPAVSARISSILKGQKSSSALKGELFSIMKVLNSPACKERHNTCLAEKYEKSLLRFFAKNDSIMVITKIEAQKDANKKMMDKVEGRMSLTERQSDISQEGIEKNFMSTYNMDTPDICEPNITNPDDQYKCLEIWSAYCRTLDSYKDQIDVLPEEDPAIADNLADILENDFETDRSLKNSDFDRYNDENCHTKRSKKCNNPLKMLRCKATFFEFKAEYCRKNDIPECKSQNADAFAFLRQKFVDEYPGGENDPLSTAPIKEVDSSSTTGGKSSLSSFESMAKFRKQGNVSDKEIAAKVSALENKANNQVSKSASGNVSRPSAENTQQENRQLGGGTASNYNNTGPAQNQFRTPTPRMEELPQTRQAEILKDWKDEYADFKRENAGSTEPAVVSRDEVLQSRISALETLLNDQKKMTEEQRRLLDEALAEKVNSNREISEVQDSVRQRTRAPASVSDGEGSQDLEGAASRVSGPVTPAGTGAQAAAAAPASRASVSERGRSSYDSSADSIAREEAKLVNMRTNTDGTITIESASGGGRIGIIAITVPVSDEQYRLLQTNPTALNLRQIESRIPRDQIEQLERNGEIILILQNGSNPPFEVKVEKKNNRLVYSLRDRNGREQNPIRRVYTREALRNQLRAQ